jgi:hypothetical protein
MTKHPSTTPRAVRMHPPRGPENFPAPDPRAGFYQPGVSYVVGRDLTPEKAASLVQGGGYTYTEPSEAPAASERVPELPAEEE